MAVGVVPAVLVNGGVARACRCTIATSARENLVLASHKRRKRAVCGGGVREYVRASVREFSVEEGVVVV